MIKAAHKQGELYQRAVLLAKEIYRLTESFPDTERTVLTYTLRRLAVLLCQHIADASLKNGKKQRAVFKNCVDTCIAIDTQLEIALTVNLMTTEAAAEATTHLEAVYDKVLLFVQKNNRKKNDAFQ